MLLIYLVVSAEAIQIAQRTQLQHPNHGRGLSPRPTQHKEQHKAQHAARRPRRRTLAPAALIETRVRIGATAGVAQALTIDLGKGEIRTTVGTKCFGICTALAIVAAVAAAGAVGTSAAILLNSKAALAKLEDVQAEMADDRKVRCREVRDVIFDVRMGQIAMGVYFESITFVAPPADTEQGDTAVEQAATAMMLTVPDQFARVRDGFKAYQVVDVGEGGGGRVHLDGCH